MDNHYFGLDFGTSNSSIAFYKNSNITVAPNRIGERATPSLVLFSENSKDIFIGEDVLDQNLEGATLIYDVKRFVGLSYEQFKKKKFSEHLNYTVIDDGGKPKIKVKYNGKEELYTAEEISSFIIQKIVYNAKEFIKTSITKAVIAVPVHFSENQIDGICESAKGAGIEITRVIKEPTAAALAYGMGKDLIFDNSSINNDICSSFASNNEVAPSPIAKSKVEENVMIFDLGGGTFDITVLNIRKLNEKELNFDIRATNGIPEFGGSDFDNKLVDYCVKKFCQKTNKKEEFVKNNIKAYKRLKVKCENAKKLLSINNESIINMDNFDYEEDIPIKITTSQFEDICYDLFEKIEFKIQELFDKSESPIKKEEINSIILIGGATRMPGIKKLLKKIFKDENKIKDSINPEEAVSIGAALEAAKIEESQRINFTLQDIIPYNLGIAVANQNINEINKGEKMYTLIKKFSRIPTEQLKEKSFEVNLSKESPDIIVNIYEGNDPYVSGNCKLGFIRIDNLKSIGKIIYKIQFCVDVNSKLRVNIKIDSLGINQTKEIEKGVTHAFLDKKNKKISICKSKQINTISSIISNIDFYKSTINSSIGPEKYEKLKECSNEYEDLINNYMKFANNNDFVFEKINLYTKELFKIYIELFNSDENIKDEVSNIITKIKGFMKNLISFIGYVTCLIDLFSDLRMKEYFYKILINYLELMIEEGNNRSKIVKFRRYYSKLYFEKAFFVYKKYIKNEEFKIIDYGLSKQLKKLYQDIEKNLNQIDSFAFLINSLAEEKKILFGSSGYTKAIKEIEKLKRLELLTTEELEDLLDLFQNMSNTFQFKEKNIGQAFCFANIIKINYKILKNKNLSKLEDYIDKLEIIMSEREDQNYQWYIEIKDIIKEINKELGN